MWPLLYFNAASPLAKYVSLAKSSDYLSDVLTTWQYLDDVTVVLLTWVMHAHDAGTGHEKKTSVLTCMIELDL
jgi:hypothetical protein